MSKILTRDSSRVTTRSTIGISHRIKVAALRCHPQIFYTAVLKFADLNLAAKFSPCWQIAIGWPCQRVIIRIFQPVGTFVLRHLAGALQCTIHSSRLSLPDM